MTQKRYFYTDPLAAAWMQEKFGMKLYRITTQDMVDEYGCGEVGDQFDWNDSSIMQDVDTVSELLTHLHDLDYGRIYVHSDSLQLLEPQAGDLIRFDGGEFGVASKVSAEGVETQPYKQSGLSDDHGVSILVIYEMSEVGVIIQRNGTAFIVPESETA